MLNLTNLIRTVLTDYAVYLPVVLVLLLGAIMAIAR
jgi:hypothetical protein